MRRALLGLLLALLVLSPSAVRSAVPREAAADTLGASKLLCHRSLQATSWSNTNDNSFNNAAYAESNQDTSDTSQCGATSNGFHFVYSTIAAPTVVASGLNGKVAMQISGGFGSAVINFDNKASELQATSGRWGWRLYRRLGAGTFCKRGKYHQIGQNGFWSSSGTNEPINMVFGPQNAAIRDLNDNQGGNWWRIEEYINRYTSPQTRQMFIKNITTGAAESTITLSVSADADGGWVGSDAGQFKEPIHNYYEAQSGSGSCANDYMYMIMAKNLGTNERIPPASEIEAVVASPTAPSNVTVTVP